VFNASYLYIPYKMEALMYSFVTVFWYIGTDYCGCRISSVINTSTEKYNMYIKRKCVCTYIVNFLNNTIISPGIISGGD
jgi:hypothetical protein